MSRISNAIWNMRIGRKLNKLNRQLAEEEAREFTEAITIMAMDMERTVVEVKLMDKALQRAMKGA